MRTEIRFSAIGIYWAIGNWVIGHSRATHGQGISLSYAQLFCLIPQERFSRWSWSTRPVHLCRFAVRALIALLATLFPAPETTQLSRSARE